MAKKRRKSSCVHTPSSATGLKGIATKALSIIGGLAVGTYVKNFVGKKDVSGTDLLGLSGDASAYTTPAIVTAIGVGAMMYSKNAIVKDVALGVAVAGGSGLINSFMGKSVVSLGDAEDMPAVPLLPGIGDVDPNIRYDQLPSENEQVTTYNPVYEAGDVVNGTEPMIL